MVLTWAEFDALLTLIRADGTPVSVEDLSHAALGRGINKRASLDALGDRSVAQLIYALRTKLPRDEDGEWYIQTARNQGYWIRKGTGAREG